MNEEVAALRKAKTALDAETPLRAAGLEPQEAELLRGIAPLTMKPEVVVANLEEGLDVPPELASEDAVGVYASIEAETAEMDPEEARALLEEFGVAEPGLEKVIHAGYRALDLITFLTTGEDETRAWEVRRGAHAPEAAGVIHTDLQRGFIRADVIGYDELVAQGSMEDAKTHGKIRVEGQGLPGAGGRHPARPLRGLISDDPEPIVAVVAYTASTPRKNVAVPCAPSEPCIATWISST